MKRYLLLHIGFEKPTEDVMKAWGAWFQSIADRNVEQAGLGDGLEITEDGTRELPFGPGSITGYNVIEAGSMDEAEEIARRCPFIDAIRVYEMRAE